MIGGAEAIQRQLQDLFARPDVLGVVAASRDGLVLGAVGMPADQAGLIAALGAPLASVADRAMERLGERAPNLLSISSPDGMLHVRGTRDLALIVLTDRCEMLPLIELMDLAVRDLAAVFSPV
jgi:predicted regulator of Ras-like GTPase activity (Roadblock/LC7/MglB family)